MEKKEPPRIPEAVLHDLSPGKDTQTDNDDPRHRLRSPNGRYIACVLSEERDRETGLFSTSLYCVPTDRRHRARRLYRAGTVHEPRIAAWSPDSQQVLFWRCGAHVGSANADGSPLYDIAVTGGKPRLLTTPYRDWNDDDMMRGPRTLTFSPDGRHLLLVAGGSRFFVEHKWIVCLEYPSARRIWMTEPGWAAIDPAWSPDGRQIAFTRTPDPHHLIGEFGEIAHRNSRMHLCVMNADGTGRRTLTNDPRYRESEPGWITTRTSGDGRHDPRIQFIRDDNADLADNVPWRSRRSLWEIRPDGTGLRWIRKLPPEPLD